MVENRKKVQEENIERQIRFLERSETIKSFGKVLIAPILSVVILNWEK